MRTCEVLESRQLKFLKKVIPWREKQQLYAKSWFYLHHFSMRHSYYVQYHSWIDDELVEFCWLLHYEIDGIVGFCFKKCFLPKKYIFLSLQGWTSLTCQKILGCHLFTHQPNGSYALRLAWVIANNSLKWRRCLSVLAYLLKSASNFSGTNLLKIMVALVHVHILAHCCWLHQNIQGYKTW